MDLKLKDKVVLVTGGTGGIGSAIVKGFLAEGAKVAFSSTSQAKIDAIVSEYAVKGAQYVADPNLYYVDNGQSLPTEVRNMDIEQQFSMDGQAKS